jgi:hypothetical protein
VLDYQADQGSGDGLIRANTGPDILIQNAVQLSCRVLIGVSHAQNREHDDRQQDDDDRCAPRTIRQQKSVFGSFRHDCRGA